MPYLGNAPTANFASVTKDTFSGNGSTTAFTLSKTATTNGVAVYVENVRQIPTTAYSVSGTTLTFTGTPPSGTNNIYVMHHNTPVSTATHPSAQALTATTGTFTSTVDINGSELILDADADTSITADTDDQIDFKTGGTDRMNIKSDGNIQFSNGGTSYGNISLTNTDNLTIDCTSSGHAGITFGSAEIFPRKNSANADDDVNIGAASIRFDDIYATNGTIQTSDQNEKQDIASATAKELNVAKKLSSLFKTFRWKSKVEEKGDNARTHTGIIAQEIQSAFSAEGLDASKYGLFISHTWWEKDNNVYNTEKEAPSDATKRTRLGVRYPELFSFIFSSIEARLTALESK